MKQTYPSIPGLEPDAWSNDACRGYVIMAMQDCGFLYGGPHMGNVVPVCVWIITIPILAYGICAVNRNDVPVWESLVPM